MTETDAGNEETLRDPLTGCLNQRGILIHSEPLFTLPDKRLGLVKVNIDHFATINDQYGHEAGDKIVQAIAYIFNSSLRTSDLVAHPGGETFILLVQGIGVDSGWGTCERLRQRVEHHGWENIVPGQRVTVSIGFALRLHGETLDMLASLADGALARAQSEGRNRVVSAA